MFFMLFNKIKVRSTLERERPSQMNFSDVDWVTAVEPVSEPN